MIVVYILLGVNLFITLVNLLIIRVIQTDINHVFSLQYDSNEKIIKELKNIEKKSKVKRNG